MASHDYYDSFQRRNDAPLPPVPSSDSRPPYPDSHHHPDVSPVNSRIFDDHTYATQLNPSVNQPTGSYANVDSSYHGAYGGGKTNRYSNNDPFTDQNAIQMEDQSRNDHKRHDSSLGDEEGRRPRRSRRKEKKGLLGGKITWVCWIFTVVQVAVFIGELVRNGEQCSPLSSILELTAL